MVTSEVSGSWPLTPHQFQKNKLHIKHRKGHAEWEKKNIYIYIIYNISIYNIYNIYIYNIYIYIIMYIYVVSTWQLGKFTCSKQFDLGKLQEALHHIVQNNHVAVSISGIATVYNCTKLDVTDLNLFAKQQLTSACGVIGTYPGRCTEFETSEESPEKLPCKNVRTYCTTVI